MRDSVKEMSVEELESYDKVDVDGFVAWAYLQTSWFIDRYREYLEWCGLNDEEIEKCLEKVGLRS